MGKKIGLGLLGLGTVGVGVVKILQTPDGRHPLVGDLELVRVSVRDISRSRPVEISSELITNDPLSVVEDPRVDVVVEVMGGIEPARTLIMRAISLGKSVVTANKAVIARHGEEIASAASAAGVYVLIEAAVGGGIPIIEPLKQSLGGNRIEKITGIINGTTNYILSCMAGGGVSYEEVLKEAQGLGYAEADPFADVGGIDAADKIAILSWLAFGGPVERSSIPTQGISELEGIDVEYANKLGYRLKLIALAERIKSGSNFGPPLPLAITVQPTLVPANHPLASVNGVNNAILVEGDPIGEVMFYGPGAGSGPTASAVVADILNIAGVRQLGESTSEVDSLLSFSSWRRCSVVDSSAFTQRNYVRIAVEDAPGVIGLIGTCFGQLGISIQSIVQFETTNSGAEIVVITHEVKLGQMLKALTEIKALPEIKEISSHLACL